MESGKTQENCNDPSSKNFVTTGRDGKPPRRAKSVYDALNVLGHSVNNIYDKITRKSRHKRSSESESLSDLHLASTDQDSQKISSSSSLNSSTSDLRETPYVFKPAPTISDISEGTFSSEDGDDEMEVHWQDLSSLESHQSQNGSGDDSTVPSIPKRKFSHRKISSENKNIASSKWIESATAEMESILINGHADIPEIVEDDNEKKLKPTLKIRHDHTPRKTISFETRTDDKDEDTQSDTDSACDIPKHKSYRTARKNSMAPPKAFRRTKSVDPQ